MDSLIFSMALYGAESWTLAQEEVCYPQKESIFSECFVYCKKVWPSWATVQQIHNTLNALNKLHYNTLICPTFNKCVLKTSEKSS